MRLAINQSYLFPYIGYYQLLNAVDTFILYDNLQYIQYGWVNRNRYLVVKGGVAYFRANIESTHLTTKIKDISLCANNIWRNKALKAIYLNYKKCSHFDEIFYLVENVFMHNTDSLSELNSKSIIEIARYLNIPTNIIINPDYCTLEDILSKPSYNKNFPEICLNYPSRKVYRILDICRSMKADIFINLIGGQDLYDKLEFKNNGVDLLFLKSIDLPYQQRSSRYIPRLSIIDVLMNCGRKKTIERLESYELI